MIKQLLILTSAELKKSYKYLSSDSKRDQNDKINQKMTKMSDV